MKNHLRNKATVTQIKKKKKKKSINQQGFLLVNPVTN